MGLREKQTTERRERILDAARNLIRETAGTDWSMRLLAQKAEVSLATPYNLFGSKTGVLYALLNKSLDEVDRATRDFSSADPIERMLEVAGIAADVYARDPEFHRPLSQFLLGARDVSHRPEFIARSLERWNRTVQAGIRHGLLPASIPAELLARQLMLSFIGALELWIHEEIDDEAFRAQSLYGATLSLLAYSELTARVRLVTRVRALEARLPKELKAPGELVRGPRNRKRIVATG
ncbi:MAG: TetR/AcrR family transcriptional regulator [Candidatus Binatia bacterium]